MTAPRLQTYLAFFFTLALHLFCHSLRLDGALLNKVEVHQVTFSNPTEKEIASLLLPVDHPIQNQLKELFKDPNMFQAIENFRQAGFDVVRSREDLLLGTHNSIKGFLIKKFSNKKSQSEQLKNYIKRIKGAKILRKYIQAHKLKKHFLVPKKWLYELPPNFSKSGRAYLCFDCRKNEYFYRWR